MLNQSINGRKWTAKTLRKLESFLERAPIVATCITSNTDEGVFIVIKAQKEKEFFPFDYEMEPKAWIHNIKDWLVKFYPRLIEVIRVPHLLTADEKALYIEKTGCSIDSVPEFEERISQINSWRIDKFLKHRDILLLLKEGEYVEGNLVPTKEPIMRRFSYTGSTVLFLRRYRMSKYEDIPNLSEEFFKNAIPLDDVDIKNE